MIYQFMNFWLDKKHIWSSTEDNIKILNLRSCRFYDFSYSEMIEDLDRRRVQFRQRRSKYFKYDRWKNQAHIDWLLMKIRIFQVICILARSIHSFKWYWKNWFEERKIAKTKIWRLRNRTAQTPKTEFVSRNGRSSRS